MTMVDEYDKLIEAAHPANNPGREAHNTYLKAHEMVSKRESKNALVSLVNWLLVENARLKNVSEYFVRNHEFEVGGPCGCMWCEYAKGQGPHPDKPEKQ